MRALFEDDDESEVGIALGADERLLWEGRPRWQTLAVRSFHARKVAIYFAILAVWSVADAMGAGAPLATAVGSIGRLALVGSFAVACLVLLAWLAAWTTTYRITDRRVLMRIGIAMPASIYLPLRLVEAASLGKLRDGTGDISLALPQGERFAWLLLWPHARPWHLRQPQPTLRALPDAEHVARILGEALARTADAASVTQSTPARTPRNLPQPAASGSHGALPA